MSAELNLRPFQALAIQSLREGIGARINRQMLYAPTGAGKTIIATGMVKGATAKGKRVAFLVNRIQLVEQTSKVFTKYGIPHGVIQGQNTVRTYENVLIASIQTVATRGLPDVDFIVIDEAHAVAGSKEYRAVIAACKGKPVVGLSASPFSKGLGKHYDELGGPLFERMVIAATISELIEEKYLVDCDVYAPSEPDMTGIKQARNSFGEMDYSDMDVGRAANKPELVGDIIKHWMRLAKDTPTVVFAANIAHSKHIVEQFLAAGVAAEHIDCYDDTDARRAALARFESGETKIISNSALLAEGWDAPYCKTLILARPTKSLIRYIQMAGRVLRPHDTKDRALILDHSGTVTRLGFPTADFPLELDDGKPKDAAAPEQREKSLPKACPKCSYLKTVHACPVCGFAPEKQSDVEVKDGELVLLDKRKTKATKIDKQAFYSQLLAIASTKGYQGGWVSHKYREKFGVWPKGLEEVAIEPTAEVRKFLQHLQIRHAKSAGGARAAA
jgi:superfamily II DNA or RNA helicase